MKKQDKLRPYLDFAKQIFNGTEEHIYGPEYGKLCLVRLGVNPNHIVSIRNLQAIACWEGCEAFRQMMRYVSWVKSQGRTPPIPTKATSRICSACTANKSIVLPTPYWEEGIGYRLCKCYWLGDVPFSSVEQKEAFSLFSRFLEKKVDNTMRMVFGATEVHQELFALPHEIAKI